MIKGFIQACALDTENWCLSGVRMSSLTAGMLMLSTLCLFKVWSPCSRSYEEDNPPFPRFFFDGCLQGHYKILSLMGSLFPPEPRGGNLQCFDGRSVSLACADGRVIGGTVAGLLLAASPIKVSPK